ncbi:hypothetical protein [Thioalkalivibrio sp. ALJ3]|uniref:hypothetical protein n=1 Tax=Thioalkalivibrio sp. ALJ3 TaxID=1240557 RepID=UPI00037EECE1|nr:hypothetical protein [Thioalkalivibrio sp. ALJ3]
MANSLRKDGGASAAALVARLPLPDMVVHVSAPGAVRAARVALRDKSDHMPKRYLAGAQAIEAGSARARQWNALWGPDEALRCLRAWSRWQCRPVLDDSILQTMLEESIDQPLTEKDGAALRNQPVRERERWLRDAFVDHGVHWLDVVNDGREPAEVHARRIAEAIHQWRG